MLYIKPVGFCEFWHEDCYKKGQNNESWKLKIKKLGE